MTCGDRVSPQLIDGGFVTHLHRRADIQVLRGIAVVLVFLFHINMPWFGSGFIGGDIFFVISGFLMALTLRSTNFSSVFEFYLRRARRILPAYFAVLFAVLAIGSFYFLPFEVDELNEDLPFYLFGAANIGLWLEVDYFSEAAFQPVLHFWSLGVELQFYLVLPIIAFAYERHRLTILAFALISLVACALVQGYSEKTAFFLTPFRIWEFLAGYAVAKWALSSQMALSRPVSLTLFYAGLALILALSGLSEERALDWGFPWPVALPAVLASVLMIVANYQPVWQLEKWVHGVFEWLGELSYSIYLIHFPVIFFLFYIPFEGGDARFDEGAKIGLVVVVTLVLSWLSYRFIEQPFRRIKTFSQPSLPVYVTGVVVPAFAFLIVTQPWKVEANSNQPVDKVYAAMQDTSEVFRCHFTTFLTEPTSKSCQLTAAAEGTDRPKALLVGNSHANAIKEALIDRAEAGGIELRMIKDNVYLGLGDARPKILKQEMIEHDIDYLIVHARWNPNPSRIPRNVAAIRATAEMASGLGAKMIFLDPVPIYDVHIPKVVLASLKDEDVIDLPDQTYLDYLKSNRPLLDGIEDIQSDAFVRFQVGHLFCKPDCAVLDDEGKLLYMDEHHLTNTGAEYIGTVLDGMFQFIEDDFASEDGKPASEMQNVQASKKVPTPKL